MAYQKAPNASFAVHAGDLVNRAQHDNEWAQWFKAGGFIHSQWTAIPVVGNHEIHWVTRGEAENRHVEKAVSMQWRPQFTLPVEEGLVSKLHESVYTVDYQDIRIIVLNSNDYLEPQTEYIEQQLKNCTAKWKIITCHHSVFSPAKGRNFQFARDHWKPLLDKYGVDLVLNGHDHTYARGHVPVRTADGKDTRDLGTVYVTSVSGPKMYASDPEQMDSYRAEGYRPDKTADQTQFFQVITVENDTLTYVAYTAVGEEHDRATITKDFTTSKKTLGKQGE
jgi:3',5'-cyclic AMP phosphodiesterase CpdA